MNARRERRHWDRNGARNSLAEGTYIGDVYLNKSEYAKCDRCGIERRIQSKRRVGSGMCQDCYYTEKAAAKLTPEPLDVPLVKVGLIWQKPKQPQPQLPQRMSAEDMAWCEQQAKEFNERRPVIYYRTKQQKDVAA